MKPGRWLTLVGVVLVAGCGGGREEQADDGMEGMKGMDTAGGTQGMAMPGLQMMPMMRAHMDSMVGMSPQQMQAMMARHQDMMSRMMDGMGSDMRGMNMTASAEWTALTDSVKRDLADLPGLDGQPLADRMRDHTERVRRLITMHEGMIKM
jgi:hypothetical protein